MIDYYEIKILDKGIMRAVKQTILLLGLFLFFIAGLLIIFAIIITLYLIIPAVIIIIIGLIIGSFAQLLTKDYMYIVNCGELIIKRKVGSEYKEISRVGLSDINAVQMTIISDAYKYTPKNIGVTLMTNDKNYAITPDDYLLAIISNKKVIL